MSSPKPHSSRTVPSDLSVPLLQATVGRSYTSRLKVLDYVLVMLVWLLSFLVFINAGRDFSYDYTAYLYYFEALADVGFHELILNMLDQFPLPYVYFPPSGLFEFGFASLVWLIMKLFGSASASYAVIGSTSIMVRIWLLRKMGVHWGWILLTSIYSITLFEANAIRLGCAFTLFLLGMLFVLQRRSATHICLTFLLASLFHLQILFEVCFFLVAFFGQKLLFGSQLRLVMSVMLIVVFGVSTVGIVEQLGLSKLEDYDGVFSGSGGVNVTSLLGILIWLSIFWHLIRIPGSTYSEKVSHLETSVWIAAVLAGIPALLLFVSVTSIGAITDRFWQVAFMMLAAVSFVGAWRQRLRRYQVLLICTLVLVASVNVIFRYPLSNFFYPLVPYAFIVPFHSL